MISKHRIRKDALIANTFWLWSLNISENEFERALKTLTAKSVNDTRVLCM